MAAALIAFASACAQIGRGVADRPLACASGAAIAFLVVGACMPGLLMTELEDSAFDPRLPATASLLAACIGAAAAITSSLVRREVGATAAALDAKLAAAPTVPAAIARIGDAP
jgi:hypothetical protein